MPPMPSGQDDLTHQELMDRIEEMLAGVSKQLDEEIERLRSDIRGRDAALDERLRFMAERLDSGAGRFARIEELVATGNAHRDAQGRLITGITERLLTLEAVRKIEDSVSEKVAERVDRVRKYLFLSLRMILPPGVAAGIVVAIYERWWGG